MTAADQTLSVRFEADVAELRAALADVSKRVKQYEKDAEKRGQQVVPRT